MTAHRRDRADLIEFAIRDGIRLHGYAPSVRELARIAGLASPAAAYHHLTRLASQGRIRWTPGTARSIRTLAPTIDGDLCQRPGCGKPLEGREELWCSPSCSAIAGHVRAWVNAYGAAHVLSEIGL